MSTSYAPVKFKAVKHTGHRLDPDCGTTVRETAHAALSNLVTALSLADQGRIKHSEKTKRPSAASITILAASLDGGDFYSSPVD